MADSKRDKLRQHSGVTPPGITDLMARLAAGAQPAQSPAVIESLHFSMTGVEIDRDLSEDEWLDLIQDIRVIKRAYLWMLADLLKYGIERGYGDTREKYEAVARMTGYSPEALQNFATIARSVEISRRRENLSFSHHTEVAPLPPDEQVYWLEQATVQHWSAKRLRSEIGMSRLPASAGIETSPDELPPSPALSDEMIMMEEAVTIPDIAIKEVKKQLRKFVHHIETDTLQEMPQDELYLLMLYVQRKYAERKRMVKRG